MTEVAVRDRQVRPQSDRPPVAFNRLIEPIQPGKQLTKVVMGLGKVWRERQCALAAGNGFLEPAQISQRIREVVTRHDEVRLYRNRPTIAPHRLIEPIQPGKQLTEVVMGLGKVWRERQCALA